MLFIDKKSDKSSKIQIFPVDSQVPKKDQNITMINNVKSISGNSLEYNKFIIQSKQDDLENKPRPTSSESINK